MTKTAGLIRSKRVDDWCEVGNGKFKAPIPSEPKPESIRASRRFRNGCVKDEGFSDCSKYSALQSLMRWRM